MKITIKYSARHIGFSPVAKISISLQVILVVLQLLLGSILMQPGNIMNTTSHDTGATECYLPENAGSYPPILPSGEHLGSRQYPDD